MLRIERYGLISHSYLKGRTRGLEFYRVGEPGKLVLVDAPGYGVRGKVNWGELFNEYIETREQYAFPTNCVALNQTLLFFQLG